MHIHISDSLPFQHPQILLSPPTWPSIFQTTTPLTINPKWIALLVSLVQVRSPHRQGIVILTTFRTIADALVTALRQHTSRLILTDCEDRNAALNYIDGSPDAILIAKSCWQGIRFPRTHLHDLIVTNLPAIPPETEIITTAPMDPYSLRSLIVQFRQGIARGHRIDHIAPFIAITDPRIHHPICKHWYLKTPLKPELN